MKLCEYGCDREAKYQFKNGKWCCSSHVNKCSARREEFSKSNRGQIGYWLGKNRSKETMKKLSEKNKHTIEQIQEKYPTFVKEEEMRYNPDKLPEKEIQFHCKYSECKNSKEKGGWFTPTYWQFKNRIDALEHDDGNDGRYFYCSKGCKQNCCLYYFKRDPNTRSQFEKYFKIVNKKTNKTKKKFYYKIENIELQGKKCGYALDHKYSIYDGFINNVDPKIIAHHKNLECIPESDNNKKGRNSSITLEELKKQIGNI